jgi:N-acetylglucosamine-6-phosphate deacetylase
MVNLVWKVLGAQRVNLVTDAMAAIGMSPGEYQLGGSIVYVGDSSARLEDG